MYDNEAVEPVSPAAYADARKGPGDRDLAVFSRITKLLMANGHSPAEAAEIVRVAQRSWPAHLAG